VSLQWEPNPTATKFRLVYTYDGINFVPVPPPVDYSTEVLVRRFDAAKSALNAVRSLVGAWAADAINTTTYTIHGLAEFRRYYIQIYGGDESQGDNNFDSTFYVVEVKTLVLRTCALLLE